MVGCVCNLSTGVERCREGELHIGLPAANKCGSKVNILQRGSSAAARGNVQLMRPACAVRGKKDAPQPRGVRGIGEAAAAIDFYCYSAARDIKAPHYCRLVVLQDHVAGEEGGKREIGGEGGMDGRGKWIIEWPM